jgi:uncharacterized surface protein with fasciclin (FAS1) repeats
MKRLGLILAMVIFGLKVFSQSAVNDTLKFISSKKNINIFLNAIDSVGMSSIFTANNAVTIFAPDDKSMNTFPGPSGMKLFFNPSNRSILLHIVEEHIINGKYTAKDISNQIRKNNGQTQFITLAGTILKAKINSNRNIVLIDTDGVEHVIKQFDIKDGNTEIFVIDTMINIHE